MNATKTKRNQIVRRHWNGTRAFLLAAFVVSTVVTLVIAHEGHTPLPSKGAQVDVAKGHIVLSADARAALDMQTTEIGTTAPPALDGSRPASCRCCHKGRRPASPSVSV